MTNLPCIHVWQHVSITWPAIIAWLINSMQLHMAYACTGRWITQVGNCFRHRLSGKHLPNHSEPEVRHQSWWDVNNTILKIRESWRPSAGWKKCQNSNLFQKIIIAFIKGDTQGHTCILRQFILRLWFIGDNQIIEIGMVVHFILFNNYCLCHCVISLCIYWLLSTNFKEAWILCPLSPQLITQSHETVLVMSGIWIRRNQRILSAWLLCSLLSPWQSWIFISEQ